MHERSRDTTTTPHPQLQSQWVALADANVEVCTLPVAWRDYVAFARDTGRPEPVHHGSPDEAVTGISGSDAEAYARWLSEEESQSYRLPTVQELHAFVELEAERLSDYFDQPHDAEDLSRLGPAYLEEWVAGEDSDKTAIRYHLHAFAAPGWLLSHRGHMAEAALADSPHGFVTFRLVRSPRLP